MTTAGCTLPSPDKLRKISRRMGGDERMFPRMQEVAAGRPILSGQVFSTADEPSWTQLKVIEDDGLADQFPGLGKLAAPATDARATGDWKLETGMIRRTSARSGAERPHFLAGPTVPAGTYTVSKIA